MHGNPSQVPLSNLPQKTSNSDVVITKGSSPTMGATMAEKRDQELAEKAIHLQNAGR